MARRRRVTAVLVATLCSVPLVAWSRVWLDDDAPSTSHGTDADGSIEHAHPIPPSGEGYSTYSILGSALGRQYVHRGVRDAWLAATREIATTAPERTFVLAETGWPGGGRFRPHRTHRRGLSIDVLSPMRDADGGRVNLSSWPWDRFGYGHELDDSGRLESLRFDGEDVASLVCALVRLAPDHGVAVRRVILAPELQPSVERAASCELGPLWMRGTPWVRHDEHFHVDFEPQ